MTQQEYIYAIGHPHEFVKIGRSNDPQNRLRSHQTSSPYELWLITAVPVDDATAVEAEVHDLLDGKRVRGEWFELEADDYDLLADMVKMSASTHTFESVADFREWQAQKREAML